MKTVNRSHPGQTPAPDATNTTNAPVADAALRRPFRRSFGGVLARLPDEQRRGVVIILALAVLAIIALAALSYMTVVRSDRVSSVIVSERAAFDRQHAVVVDHIAGLLTADLFGQKVVTPDVPRTVRVGGNDFPNWPQPFEDGNQWDYPHADPWFLTDANNGRILRANENDPIDRIAQPSQPWLASTEPHWDVTGGLNNLDRTKVWFQVTNLRGGYRWDPNAGADGAWVRGDGKFADLMQFFVNPVNNQANPRVDFLGLTSTPDQDRGEFIDPRGGSFFRANSAPVEYGLNNPFSNNSRDSVAVFDIPMTEMTRLTGDADTGPGRLDNADERWWVDTMGDGRPDARWQVLEALGDLGGLRWFVAARIIDASGLLNYNTALEYSYAGQNLAIAEAGTSFNKVPGTQLDRDPRGSTGRTPADVDLFGLIYEMSGGDAANGFPGVFDTGPDGDPIRLRNDLFTFAGDPSLSGNDGIDAFEDHLYNGLGLRGFLTDADRAADQLLNPTANNPAVDAPSFFDPAGGGFGAGFNWRTRGPGIPSLNGFPPVRNYTQFNQPSLGIPDHTIAEVDFGSGGLTTDTTSNTPQVPTLTDSQRRAFYTLGVLAGDAAPIRGLRQYPASDLIDLRSFWGTNSDGLSEIERRIDGPQGTEGFNNGLAYLPDGGLSDDLTVGPLRSRQSSLSARLAMSNDSLESARPTNEQLYHDIRRLLTPHSGAAPFSVIPLLNPAHPAYQSGAIRTKPIVGRSVVDQQEVTALFDGFVWALAPQAARLSNNAQSNEIVPTPWRGDRPLPYTELPAAVAGNPASPAPYYGGGGTQGVDGLTAIDGPATRLADVGFGPFPGIGFGGTPPPVGASYALRTALALTANTISASRAQSTSQNPTPAIVRFFPAGDSLPPGQLLPPIPAFPQLPDNTIPVYAVSGRFPFGDLPQQAANQQLLPPFYLGTEQTGITAVGLQRQPFLIGAYSLAVYENPVGELAISGATVQVDIDPRDPRARLGSILAIEIGNPWDTSITMTDYEVQIHTSKLAGLPAASAIRINLNSAVLSPGERRVFVVLTGNANGPPRTADTMLRIYETWLAELQANAPLPAVPSSVQLINQLPGGLGGGAPGSLVDIQSPDPAADPEDGILFNRLTTGEIIEVPVLLVHRIGGEFGDAPNRRTEVLVDRMLPNFAPNGTPDLRPFPAFYPIDPAGPATAFSFDFTIPATPPLNPPGQYLFARVTRESEFRRPIQNAMRNTGGFMGGFPAYVIERPSENLTEVQGFEGADPLVVQNSFSNFDMLNTATPPDLANPTTAFLTTGNPNGNFSINAAALRLGEIPMSNTFDDDQVLRPVSTNPALRFAESFELYVPTQGILTKADVLRLTAFAHLYRPEPPGPQRYVLSVSEGNAGFSSFLLNGQLQNANAGVPDSILNPNVPYWLTVSEQLGLSANLVLSQNSAEVAVNPYFHVLNPLRDHRQVFTNASNLRLADALTIPPAVRILDNIEIFQTERGLIPGRVNINTAPDQVLKSLPLMMPRRDLAAWQQPPFNQINTINSNLESPMSGGGSSGQRFMETYSDTRIETLTTYRDRFNRASTDLPSPVTVNSIVGLQDPGVAPYRQPGGQRNGQPRGIVSIGELANLHRWQAAGVAQQPDRSSGFFLPRATVDDAQRGFAQLGVNPTGLGRAANFGPPFEMELPNAATLPNVVGAPVNPSTTLGVAKPADDPGERLAIFRAMSNIIETRSDVFLATFVVRGYRPSIIESIRVGNNPSDAEAAAAMNSERFRPEYESRWLVLFDRSNVRLPTDRPRVLLKAELPPARR